jgi:hypothetical protein
MGPALVIQRLGRRAFDFQDKFNHLPNERHKVIERTRLRVATGQFWDRANV